MGRAYPLSRCGWAFTRVLSGIVGVKKLQYDIRGDTVNTASRMESSGEVGQVNISEATHALMVEQASRLFTFTPRGLAYPGLCAGVPAKERGK